MTYKSNIPINKNDEVSDVKPVMAVLGRHSTWSSVVFSDSGKDVLIVDCRAGLVLTSVE